MYIHSYSSHNLTKIICFLCFHWRALRISSPEYLDEDIHAIDKIELSLCCTTNFIPKCKEKLRKKFYSRNHGENTIANAMLILSYYSCFQSIKGLFPVVNLKIVFTYNATISKTLIKMSPEDNRAIIYKVPCKKNAFKFTSGKHASH